MNLIKYESGNATAIIVLHEIYGINDFIMEICCQYHVEGYDVFCPNLLNSEESVPYSKEEEAYRTFIETVGFDGYEKINLLATRLKETYLKVVIVGFSVGATIGWRCSEQIVYDGIICCYGSRIRDYLTINPKCPVLLVFAKDDSFDVVNNRAQLQSKENVTLEIVEASHGFVDFYSKNYNYLGAEIFNQRSRDFLEECTQ